MALFKLFIKMGRLSEDNTCITKRTAREQLNIQMDQFSKGFSKTTGQMVLANF